MTSKTQRLVDERIDRFVERVRGGYRPPLFPEYVPDSLRIGPPSLPGEGVSWTVIPASEPCGWIDDFERRLPGPLPRSYKSLVSRYLFPVLEIGPVMLFGNTGRGAGDELVDAVFRDAKIYEPLVGAGFVQFGCPTTGSYDPVCFDLNTRSNSGECRVVRLDHERVLRGRVDGVTELAGSFLELIGGEE